MNDGIGVDGLKFTMPCPSGFDGQKRTLTSRHNGGGEYATLERIGKNVVLNICMPRYLELTNLHPFSESRYARDIVPQIQRFLVENGLNESFSIVTAEVNTTIDISEFARCADVVDFFSCALLSSYAKIFQCFSARQSRKYQLHIRDLESLKTLRHSDGTHILKCYNKSRELGFPEDRQILRYELVFQQRVLKRLFQGDLSIFSIISEVGTPRLIDFFCSTTIDKVLPELKRYQENCVDCLAGAFECADSITEAFSEFAMETFVDSTILKKALDRFYTGKENGAQYKYTMHKYLTAKYGVPSGVCRSIKRIYRLCKNGQK